MKYRQMVSGKGGTQNQPTSVGHSEINARESRVKKNYVLRKRAYSVLNRNYLLDPVIKSHTVKLSLSEPTDQLWLSDVQFARHYKTSAIVLGEFHHFLITGLQSLLLLSFVITSN